MLTKKEAETVNRGNHAEILLALPEFEVLKHYLEHTKATIKEKMANGLDEKEYRELVGEHRGLVIPMEYLNSLIKKRDAIIKRTNQGNESEQSDSESEEMPA